MSTPGDGRERQTDHRHFRAISLSLMIPALLVAAPLVGLGIGWWLDRRFDTTWCKIVGVIVGFVAGGRETYHLVRKITKDLE